MAWDASRRTRTAAQNPALVAAIDTAFHTTSHNDLTIIENITSQGIPITRNQVEEIRLTHGWRRRANNDDQLAEARALTFCWPEALNQIRISDLAYSAQMSSFSCTYGVPFSAQMDM